MSAVLEDTERRSELASQGLQREILEIDIQARLERRFPTDRIEPVLEGGPRGRHPATGAQRPLGGLRPHALGDQERQERALGLDQ
jgi:hypothetical protein